MPRNLLIFYPRTVLRAADASDGSPSSPKPLIALVAAMNKDSLGGIGPFEISLLEWIASFAMLQASMLVDLIKARVMYRLKGEVVSHGLN